MARIHLHWYKETCPEHTAIVSRQEYMDQSRHAHSLLQVHCYKKKPIQNTQQPFATKQKTIFIIKLILGKKVTEVHIMSYPKVLR